jgi:hypothetical protein
MADRPDPRALAQDALAQRDAARQALKRVFNALLILPFTAPSIAPEPCRGSTPTPSFAPSSSPGSTA